jgi:PEP-CTERM motif
VAEPVRKQHEAASESRDAFNTWSEFLKGGPSVWATHEHPIWDYTVREAVWKDIKTDPGGTSPMIDFLLWKQSLDPTRFDLYHPKIGPAIDKLVNTPPTQVQSSAPTTTSTSSTSPSEGQTISPPGTETPEPSTWLVAIGMAGWALWRRRRVVD